MFRKNINKRISLKQKANKRGLLDSQGNTQKVTTSFGQAKGKHEDIFLKIEYLTIMSWKHKTKALM